MAKNAKETQPAAVPQLPDGQTQPAPSIPADNPPTLQNGHDVKSAPVDDLKASVDASLANAPVPNESAVAAHADRQAAMQAAEETGEIKAKRKYTPRQPKAPAPGTFVNPPAVQNKKEEFRRAGRAMADTLVLVGQTLGGEDWKPVLHIAPDKSVLYDERATLREAWADMAEEYEISKMPAWAACAIATAAYIGPRLNAPSTISRWEKLQLWWKARQMKKADEKKAKEEARA